MEHLLMKMESIWSARKKKKLRPTGMLMLTCMPKHKNYNHIPATVCAFDWDLDMDLDLDLDLDMDTQLELELYSTPSQARNLQLALVPVRSGVNNLANG